MITLRYALLLAIFSALLPGAPPEGYKVSWADEFKGSRVATSRWNYRTDSKHWSTQKPENVKVSGGNLVLILKKEKAGDKEYTGAGLISKQAFRFGYYEARFRIDAGKGWHTSFWMMGHDGSGSTNTTATALELDVIENDSIDLNHYGVNLHRWQGDHLSVGGRKVEVANLAEYHVFGCEYTPTRVTYLLDGKVVQTVDVSALPHSDLHIWLTSIASFLGKTDAVDESRLPGRVLYDYVRFYTKGQ